RLHGFIISTNLKRNDSLTTRRQKNVGWKDFSGQLSALEDQLVMSGRQAEPCKPCASQHDGVPIVIGQFAQSRWNVSTKVDEFEICPLPQQLAFPSHTACGDGAAVRQRSETARMFRNQHVIHRSARKNRTNFCVRVCFTWKIFCTVDRDIDVAGKKGLLDLCGEQSFATSLTLKNPGFVASCRDDSCFDFCARLRRLNCFFNQPGLRTCELAAPRAKDDFSRHRGM